jgi:hypothetical protein
VCLRQGDARDLLRIVSDEIYKVAAEALRNMYRLLTGPGIQGHFGLRSMPERATLMGGKLAMPEPSFPAGH